MAKFHRNKVSGLLGQLVFYSVNGKDYVRSRPTTTERRSSPQNDLSKGLFSTVNKFGSSLIKKLAWELELKPYVTEYNRVRSWMRQQITIHEKDGHWLPDSIVDVCQLNTGADTRDCFSFPLTIQQSAEKEISIVLPALNPVKHIRTPRKALKVLIKAVVVGSGFCDTSRQIHSGCIEETMDWKDAERPEQVIKIPAKFKEKDMVLVALSIKYVVRNGPLEVICDDKKWMPATIIAMGRLV